MDREENSSSGDRVVYLVERHEPAGDELDIRALAKGLWRQRWLIVLVTSAFGLASATYALCATSWYRAEVTLLPVEEGKSLQGISGALGQLGGLASLVGANVGGGDNSEPLAVLGSKEFATRFIEEHSLMTVIFDGRWDALHAKWTGSGDAPDIRDAADFFDKKIRRITEDKKTGLVKLTVDWKRGDLAAAWANEMVTRLNRQMRDRALEDTEKNIAYLRSQVASEGTVSLQQSASRLLEAELEKAMVARGNEEYSFRVIDKAQVPKYRYWPRRVLIVLGGILAGGLLGCLVALIRYGLLATDRQAPSRDKAGR